MLQQWPAIPVTRHAHQPGALPDRWDNNKPHASQKTGPNVLASGFGAATHVITKATWRRQRTGRPVRGHAAFLANCCCVLTTATSSSPAGSATPAPRSSRSRTKAVYTGSPAAAYLRGWSACECCAARLVCACVGVFRVSEEAPARSTAWPSKSQSGCSCCARTSHDAQSAGATK